MKAILVSAMLGAVAMLGCGASPDGEEGAELEEAMSEEVGEVASEVIAPALTVSVPTAGLRDVGYDPGGGFTYLGHNTAAVPGCTTATSKPILSRVSMTLGTTTTMRTHTGCNVQVISPRSDGTNVFFIRDVGGTRTIRKATFAAPHAETQLATGVQAEVISVDNTNIYAVSLGGVFRIPKTGGSATQIVTAPLFGFVTFAAHDASHVYFWETPLGGATVLKRFSTTGSTVSPALVTLPAGEGFTATTHDANNIYWAQGPLGGGGKIRRLNKTSLGQTDMRTLDASTGVAAIGVNSTRLFWVLTAPFVQTKIQSRTLTNTTVRDEISGLDGAGTIGGMKVLSSFVQWHNAGTGTLVMGQIMP